MRTIGTFVAINLMGCLPPPRAWLDNSSTAVSTESDTSTSDEGAEDEQDEPPVDSPSGDSGTNDSGAVDSGDPLETLSCHSLAFEDHGRVEIKPGQLGIEHFLGSQSLTIEMWAWFSESTRAGSWLLAGVEGARAWRMAIEVDQLVLRAGMYSVTMNTPEDGWHHIAGVIDGDAGQLALYLDGEQVTTGEWVAKTKNCVFSMIEMD